MKHKNLLKNEISQIEKDYIFLNETNDELVFEINEYVTDDIAEAVSILMRIIDNNDPIWDVDIKSVGITKPARSLFWLSGGDEEWNTLMNYDKHWSKCYLDFQEEFGVLIIEGIRKSKKLRDLKDYFNKNLSLPILYDFAIKKGILI